MSSPLHPARRPLRRRALALLSALLAACGGGDGAPSSPAAPTPPVPVASVTTGAAVDTVFVGDRHALTAQPVDALGNPLAGRPVAWTSLAPLVASVDGTGLVTGIVPGQTSVTATSEGRTATVAIVVLPQPVARVAFADSVLTRDIGDTVTPAVRLLDRNGVPLPDRAIAWTSSRPDVARVDPSTGAVTAVAPGTAVISATSEGRVGTLRLTVLPPPPVARVVLAAGAPLTLDEGASAVVAAATFDSLGRPLTDRAVAFSSTAPAVATVAADGRVTGVAAGQALIVATSEGRSASLPVTVVRVPVSYVLLAVRATQHTVGDTATVAATAYSAASVALPGRPATFASDAPGVATVDAATGLVRAVGAGTATITATIEGRSQSTRLDVVASPPAELTLSPATVVLGVARTAVLMVAATDRNGRPTAAGAVTFSSSAPGVVTVGASTGLLAGVSPGVAMITAAAGTLRATAVVNVTQMPVVPPPTATGTGTFAVDVRFVGTASADLQGIARQAAARWAQVIVAGLPAHRVDIGAGACDVGMPAVHETVQNILVLVQIGAIDGAGGTIAYAGPCVLRDSPAGVGTGLPSVGAITLDSVDMRRMLNAAQATQVQDVVTHELGHILGIGTLWDASWNPARVMVPLRGDQTADLYYVGGAAVGASAALGFTAPGALVPVENDGGDGTRGSHWRESAYRSELMTGFLNARNPLSTVTVGALRDLGYTVSEARADAFSPTSAILGAGARASRAAEPAVPIAERVFAPRRVRDAAGRVTVVPPGAGRARR